MEELIGLLLVLLFGGIEAWKKQYPSLQMVIDLHRDAAEVCGRAGGVGRNA